MNGTPLSACNPTLLTGMARIKSTNDRKHTVLIGCKALALIALAGRKYVPEELLDNLDVAITSAEIEHISISLETIHEAIGILRHGKAGGDALASDRILNPPASLHQFLARLFITLLRHGFMPTALRDATIQPIPKGSKDSSLSANISGIALASSLSKVLEWSILIT